MLSRDAWPDRVRARGGGSGRGAGPRSLSSSIRSRDRRPPSTSRRHPAGEVLDPVPDGIDAAARRAGGRRPCRRRSSRAVARSHGVSLELDPGLEEMAARIEVEGKTVAYVEAALGSPARPMDGPPSAQGPGARGRSPRRRARRPRGGRGRCGRGPEYLSWLRRLACQCVGLRPPLVVPIPVGYWRRAGSRSHVALARAGDRRLWRLRVALRRVAIAPAGGGACRSPQAGAPSMRSRHARGLLRDPRGRVPELGLHLGAGRDAFLHHDSGALPRHRDLGLAGGVAAPLGAAAERLVERDPLHPRGAARARSRPTRPPSCSASPRSSARCWCSSGRRSPPRTRSRSRASGSIRCSGTRR